MMKTDVIKKAHSLGLDIVWSHSRLLLLDLDTLEDFKTARSMILCLKNTFINFTHATYTRSKNNRWHIYVHLTEDKTAMERYLLQFTMGSDKVKEMIHVNELKAYGEDLCVLFEKPGVVHTPLI